VLRPTKQDLNMRKMLLMGVATALMFMTGNAVAGGTPGLAAPNWTGFYVGVGVGGAFATHDLSAKDVLEQQNGGVVQVLDAQRLFHFDNGDGRFFGTVTLGYDQLVSPHWLAGVFVDYDFGNRDNDSRIAAIGPFTDIHVSNGNNHAWSIGGRLGFLSSPSTLLYVSAGWTQISVDGDLTFTVGDTQFRRSFDRDRDGWFVGAGIETQLGWLGSNWSLRGEYRFSQFNDDNRRFTLAEESCGAACTLRERLELDHDIDVHSVRAVLVYKFGPREEAVPAPLK
jgi:outer membrane immunogenic protein